MPYDLNIAIDGACSNNGSSNALASSALVIQRPGQKPMIVTDILHSPPIATSQRAELNALVLALEAAVERKSKFKYNPYFRAFIKTDSEYATKCMTEWRTLWEVNGWKNANGEGVANMDLILQAIQLESEVQRYGRVYYNWVERKFNRHADWAAKKALKEV